MEKPAIPAVRSYQSCSHMCTAAQFELKRGTTQEGARSVSTLLHLPDRRSLLSVRNTSRNHDGVEQLTWVLLSALTGAGEGDGRLGCGEGGCGEGGGGDGEAGGVVLAAAV